MASSSGYPQPTYSIGAVSRLTGISTKTLRTWQQCYRLGASKHTHRGREYTQLDVERLTLIKPLLNAGVRIGDIAQLPQEKLTEISQSAMQSAHENPDSETLNAVVIGHFLSICFEPHQKRYSLMNIDFPTEDVYCWLDHSAQDSCADVLFLQIDTVTNAQLNQLKHCRANGASVFILYQFANAETLALMDILDINGIIGPLDLRRIDRLVEQALVLQTYQSRLYEMVQSLASAGATATPSDQVPCECSSRLTEVIQSLTAFEQYSRQCQTDNWKDASVHSYLYSYTTQARDLMERALQTLLNFDN